jgi:DNA-binding FadR family transcriptional regulator
VLTELEALIFDELKPGELLPSEGRLAKALGVSRLTVREATSALEARGLLEIRQGRRPMVAAPSGVLVGDFFKSAINRDRRAALELLEVRMALETHIAGLAAKRATRSGITQLETAISAMHKAENDALAFHEADMRFHEQLADSTGNQLLSWLIEALAEPLRDSRLKSAAGHSARGNSIDAVIDQHQQILEAVHARNPRAARAAMARHLRETEKDLRAVLQDTSSKLLVSSALAALANAEVVPER